MSWNPGFASHDDVQPAILETLEGIAIKIQLLDGKGYGRWHVEMRRIEQRHRDACLAPGADDLVLRRLEDRRLVRSAGIPRLLRSLGSRRARGRRRRRSGRFREVRTHWSAPQAFMFGKAPTRREWAALAGQTRLEVSPEEALSAVRNAWASAQGDTWS